MKKYLLNKLYMFLEPQIEAAITNRIVIFYEALISRGQIHDAAIPLVIEITQEKAKLYIVGKAPNNIGDGK